MEYFEYEKAFSRARLTKYLRACGWNCENALTLYRYNIMLCQKFYGILNIFEVVLRNTINQHYQEYFRDVDWLKNQLTEGGMLEYAPQNREVTKIIENLQNQSRYTNDRVVSSVSLGFWTHLFTRQPFRLGGNTLLRIFPNRTHGLGQRAIFNELVEIKKFRNRIAHHEAICFDVNGNIDLSETREKYRLITKYIVFFGYQCDKLLYGIDSMPDSIMAEVDRLNN